MMDAALQILAVGVHRVISMEQHILAAVSQRDYLAREAVPSHYPWGYQLELPVESPENLTASRSFWLDPSQALDLRGLPPKTC